MVCARGGGGCTPSLLPFLGSLQCVFCQRPLCGAARLGEGTLGGRLHPDVKSLSQKHLAAVRGSRVSISGGR